MSTDADVRALLRERYGPLGRDGFDDAVDDAVDDWHTGTSVVPLHEFLGFTWAQYQQWASEGHLP